MDCTGTWSCIPFHKPHNYILRLVSLGIQAANSAKLHFSMHTLVLGIKSCIFCTFAVPNQIYILFLRPTTFTFGTIHGQCCANGEITVDVQYWSFRCMVRFLQATCTPSQFAPTQNGFSLFFPLLSTQTWLLAWSDLTFCWSELTWIDLTME